MNARSQPIELTGPAGVLQAALDLPEASVTRGLAVVCHPHPLHGGTMENKVVQTVARACVQSGWRCLRFNYRGVGKSAGAWDAGRGEVDDAWAVVDAVRRADEPLVLAGFSFGGYVAAALGDRLSAAGIEAVTRLLIAPAAVNFPVPAVPPNSLVVHGESDDVVPLQAVLDWARPQAQPVLVVPGVGHFFHGQLPLLKTAVLRHLAASNAP